MSRLARTISRYVSPCAAFLIFSCAAATAQDKPAGPPTQPPPQQQNPPLPDTPQPNAPAASPQPAPGDQSQPQESDWSSSSTPASPAPKYWTSTDPNAQITVKEDTLFRVMTNDPLSTRETKAGAEFLFTLSEDVIVDDTLIIPRGATVHATVVESRTAGTLTGSPDLILKLTSLDLTGHTYPLYTYLFKVVGASKTKPTEARVAGGAIVGALVGGVVSGSEKGATAVEKLAGVGTGAVLGAGVGTAISAATPGPILSIPAESQMDFYLASPISVVPATEKEAVQISRGMTHGGPVLYVRGETP